jgi:endo-1,4-beta-xylanase
MDSAKTSPTSNPAAALPAKPVMVTLPLPPAASAPADGAAPVATRHADRRLKDYFGPGTLVGAAVGGRVPQDYREEEEELLLRHFNAVTSENCLKPALVQPHPGQFDFAVPDQLISYARRHELNVFGHTLVWHQQCPDWFFEDSPSGGAVSRQELLRRLEQHIQTVVDRYRGRIRGWDVVNEAISELGPAQFRDTPWHRLIGDDFIARAFSFARAADPNVELYYNDFNIELPGKRVRTLDLLSRLSAEGIRVDGVGIQGHWILDQLPVAELEQAILAYRQLGLKVMITELDLDVIPRPDCGADLDWQAVKRTSHDNPFIDGCPVDVLARQAAQYAQLFELLAKYPDDVTRVSFWGLHDGRTWLNHWPWERTNHPLLFTRNCKPKPAFERLWAVRS